MEGEQPQLGDLLTMIINHLLNDPPTRCNWGLLPWFVFRGNFNLMNIFVDV